MNTWEYIGWRNYILSKIKPDIGTLLSTETPFVTVSSITLGADKMVVISVSSVFQIRLWGKLYSA